MQNTECRMDWTGQLPGFHASRGNPRPARSAACLFILLLIASSPLPAAEPPKFQLETLRGKVVFLSEALQQSGVATVVEAKDRILALQTPAGELIPLLEDPRGRAFRSDERLRKM